MNIAKLKEEAREEALYQDTDLYSFRGAQLDTLIDKVVEAGRMSVLEDFDTLMKADGFVGLTPGEWEAVRKFFRYNDEISGWKADNSADV